MSEREFATGGTNRSRQLINLVVALLVGLTALGIAAHRAENASLTGNDFTPDYVSAKALLDGKEPYAPVNKLIDRYLGVGTPYYAISPVEQINSHPPFYIVLLAPFAALPYSVARILWLAFMVAVFVVSIRDLARRLGWSPVVAVTLTALLVAAPVLQKDLTFGQINCLIMFLFIRAWCDLADGREGRAGVLLGIATALKLFPALIIIALVRRRSFKAIRYQIGTSLGLSLLGLFAVGWHSTSVFLKGLPTDAQYWRGAPGNLSISSHLYRWLVKNPWRSGTPNLPALVHVIEAALVILLVVVAIKTQARLTRDPYWAIIPIALLVTPLMWPAGLVVTLPIVLIAGRNMRDFSGAAKFVIGALIVGLLVGPPDLILSQYPRFPWWDWMIFLVPTITLVSVVLTDVMAVPRGIMLPTTASNNQNQDQALAHGRDRVSSAESVHG